MSYPFRQAKWYTHVEGTRRIRVLVVHDMEFPERKDSAEVIANDFATRGPGQKSSAHYCIDSDSIVQCVRDNDVAYAAPGCNNDGLHFEFAGFGAQKSSEWLDDYGKAMLEHGARLFAEKCKQYGIPIMHLTNAELQAGKSGIVGHRQVSEVYKKSDHTDPGPEFPWDYFLERIRAVGQPDRILRRGAAGPDVATLQEKLGVPKTGQFDEATEKAVKAIQQAHGLAADGIVGPKTRAAMA